MTMQQQSDAGNWLTAGPIYMEKKSNHVKACKEGCKRWNNTSMFRIEQHDSIVSRTRNATYRGRAVVVST